jgi:antirestriction protein ArdC
MSKAIGKDTIYREITDKIIAELERGIVPWGFPSMA